MLATKHYLTTVEIRREILKRTGQLLTPSQIGAIGKREKLSRYDKKLGFTVFDERLIDVIIEKYL